MSRTALIASLIALALLAAVAWLAIRPSPRGRVRANARLAEFDPSRVDRVKIDDPDQPFVQTIARRMDGAWLLTLAPRAGDAPTTTWPLAPGRVRTALKALSEATLKPMSAETDGVGDNPLRIELALASGARVDLALASRAIGGQRAALAGGRTGLVDDTLHQLFASPGPRDWRMRAALPGVDADTSQIAVTRGDARVALRRIGGVWRITEPTRAPADAAAVEALRTALLRLRIESFEDEPTPEDLETARLDAPMATIVAGWEAREPAANGEVHTRVEERTLRLGAPADLEGRTRFAQAGGASPLLIVSDGGALAALNADVERYLQRFAVATRPENVGMATISTGANERGYRRDASGWSELAADGAAPPANGDAIQALLSFLAERIAREVSLAAPEGYEPAATITLYDFADGPLETVEIGVAATGAFVVRSDSVYREYAAPIPDMLAALTAR